MTTLAENLRNKFINTGAIQALIGPRMYQDHPLQGPPRPFIFFQRSSVRHERALDDAQGEAPFSHSFDVECVADRDSQAEALSDAVRTLDGFTGTLGDTTIKRLFVDDQSDDYVPVGAGSDSGRFVKALRMEVFP